MKTMCRELQADEVEQEVTQRDQFNTDEVNLTATLIRESHQNSADARSKSNFGAVNTRINLISANKKNSDYFNSLFADLKPHLSASGVEITDIDFGMPNILVIEDFGTTGLTGDFMVKSDRGPFNNFWRRVGRSDKGGAKGGRWGLGKLVFSSASQIRSFFGMTVNEDAPTSRWLMGQAVLATREIDGKDYAPHVFFAEPGKDGLQLPCGDAEIVDAFATATGLTRKYEPGLSIAIPFIRGDITIDALIPEVLKNYFFPILTGRLSIEIANENINASTFDDVASRYNWQATGSNTQLLNFIREIRDATPNPPDAVLNADWAKNMENSLAGEILEELRKKITTNMKMVRVRAPVILKHRTQGTKSTFIDLYLRKTIDQSRGGALYVRGEITVPDEARYFTPRQTLAALVASDGPIVSFLGDAENPAHTKWNGNADKLRDWIAPAPRLNEIRSSLGKLQNLLLQSVDVLEKDALKDIFSLDDISPQKNKYSKPPSSTISPKPPPINIFQSLFSIVPRPGGFSIRSSGALTEDFLPISLTVSMAYDVLRGDPFVKFSPYDFDLTKTGLKIDAAGATFQAAGPNQLLIESNVQPFEINCSGLDIHRDVIVRATRTQ